VSLRVRGYEGVRFADARSPAYEAAIAEHNRAQKKYDAALSQYRSRQIGDRELLVAQREYKEATAKFDRAFAAEAGWSDGVADFKTERGYRARLSSGERSELFIRAEAAAAWARARIAQLGQSLTFQVVPSFEDPALIADAAPEWFAQMKERQAARRRDAENAEKRAGQLLSRVKELKKRGQKVGASVYPGWDSGAEEIAKRAKASYGLAARSVEDKPKFDEWMSSGAAEERDAEDRARLLERTVEDAARRNRDGYGAKALIGDAKREDLRWEITYTEEDIPGREFSILVTAPTEEEARRKFRRSSSGYSRIQSVAQSRDGYGATGSVDLSRGPGSQFGGWPDTDQDLRGRWHA
jgi:hypothetical protein